MRQAILTAILTCCCFGCGSGQPSQSQQRSDIGRLPACFAELEKLQVTAYRNQDWCKNMVYNRGKFSPNTEATCNLFKGTPVPFDAQAQKDFDAVAQAVSRTQVALFFISDLEYRADGKLKKAVFHLAAGRYSYVYFPGYGAPPPDIPRELKHTSLNPDWYYVWEDWN